MEDVNNIITDLEENAIVNNEMPVYIGTKLVQAEPCQRGGIDGIEDGYKIRYADGYESWSPKEVFEAAYRQVDGLSFGLALEAAKMGKKIARKGWNGKGQYVELGVDFDYCTINGEDGHAHHEDIGSRALVFVGTRGRQVGWLASQSDMLADDWYIVED